MAKEKEKEKAIEKACCHMVKVKTSIQAKYDKMHLAIKNRDHMRFIRLHYAILL